jgi:hypothetical protein
LYFISLGVWSAHYGIPVQRELVVAWVSGALACASLGRPSREVLRLVRDRLPMMILLSAYDFTRGAADSLGVVVHVHAMIDFDRFLFLGTTPTDSLQAHVNDPRVVNWGRPHHGGRLAGDRRADGRAVRRGQASVNQVASVPSLHSALTMLVALFLWPRVRRPLRPLHLLYPLAMGLTLMATAEHYFFDVLLGWMYAGSGVLAAPDSRLDGWKHGRRRELDLPRFVAEWP